MISMNVFQQVRLVVDRCEAAKTIEPENSLTSLQDRRACEAVGETPGDARYLNISAPLQLGGRINAEVATNPVGLTKKGFNGCIKNFVHDGEVS